MDVNLVLVKKDGRHKNFSLKNEVSVLGRREDCDFCIPLMVVSRRHCELFTDDNQIVIRDLKSKNGTFVNGELTSEKPIKAGDQLRIGPINFIIQINGKPNDEEISNIKIIEPIQDLLADVNGNISQSGTMTHAAEQDELNFSDVIEDLNSEIEDSKN